MTVPTAPRGLATPEQVAEWLQISADHLAYLRKHRRGPKSIKVGRAVRYAWVDVHAWCTANRDA